MQYLTDYYWMCKCRMYLRASINECTQCETSKEHGKSPTALEVINQLTIEGVQKEDHTATLRLIKMIIDDTGVTRIS
jgi:hypothetical protein